MKQTSTKVSGSTLAALASAVLAVGIVGCSSDEPQRPILYGTSGNRTATVPPSDLAQGVGDHTPDQNPSNATAGNSRLSGAGQSSIGLTGAGGTATGAAGINGSYGTGGAGTGAAATGASATI